jgi:hypothetical protein
MKEQLRKIVREVMKESVLSEMQLVNEGRFDADLDKIEAAVKNASSFMNVGSELKKIGVKYDFSTSMIPMYRIKVSGNTIAIVNKKYAADAERTVKDIAIGLMENVITKSVNESASKEAVGIAVFTGTRADAVDAFIQKHDLDAMKLYKSIKSANLKGRLNFVSALVGNDGNPQQRLTIKLHKKN